MNEELDYTCSVCLEVLCNPVQTPCGHSFCEDCLNRCAAQKKECPQCRNPFTGLGDIKPAAMLRRAMMMKYLPCGHCRVPFRADGLRAHIAVCRQASASSQVAMPSSAASGFGAAGSARGGMASLAAGNHLGIVSDVNRDTFRCPLCGEGPMDCISLASHVADAHAGSKEQVVCPVCEAMPWGDSQLKSGDFVEHMKRRHQFEYDRFVDYNATDEQMLERAMEVSTVVQ